MCDYRQRTGAEAEYISPMHKAVANSWKYFPHFAISAHRFCQQYRYSNIAHRLDTPLISYSSLISLIINFDIARNFTSQIHPGCIIQHHVLIGSAGEVYCCRIY